METGIIIVVSMAIGFALNHFLVKRYPAVEDAIVKAVSDAEKKAVDSAVKAVNG